MKNWCYPIPPTKVVLQVHTNVFGWLSFVFRSFVFILIIYWCNTSINSFCVVIPQCFASIKIFSILFFVHVMMPKSWNCSICKKAEKLPISWNEQPLCLLQNELLGPLIPHIGQHELFLIMWLVFLFTLCEPETSEDKTWTCRWKCFSQYIVEVFTRAVSECCNLGFYLTQESYGNMLLFEKF